MSQPSTVEGLQAAIERLRAEAAEVGKVLGFSAPGRFDRPDADRIAAAEWVVERLLLALEEPGCPGCGHRNGNHSSSCPVGCGDCSGVNGEHEDGCWRLCPVCRRGQWREREQGSRPVQMIRVAYECGHEAYGRGRLYEPA